MTREKILSIVEIYRQQFEQRRIPKKRMDTSNTIGSLTSIERLMHAHYLLDGVVEFAHNPAKEGKTARHLASVQMILSLENWYTLDELMNHNHRDTDEGPIDPTAPINIYPAGPLGFSEAGRHFYNGIFLPMVRGIGFNPIDPWTLTDASLIQTALSAPEGIEQIQKWRMVNPIIGANNVAAIEKCPIVVAILDGPDVDSGTASEIGYAAALKKPIVGYRGDFRLSSDNIGSTVNVQVEYFIRMHGGEVVTSLEVLWPLLKQWHKRLQIGK